MSRFHSPGMPCPAAQTAGLAADGDRRGLVRAGLAAAAAFVLAVLGLSLAAGAAQATTFPGTNGRIAGSGPLNTDPLNTGSKLELFTMRSTFSSPAAPPADECRLTTNPNSDFNPRFSKDGKKIVWVQDNNLWTMQLDAQGKCPDPNFPNPNFPNANPGNAKPLTTNDNRDSFVGGWCTNAANEEWVVFQSRRDGNFEVYKIQIDSNRDPVANTQTNLTNNPANDSQPSVKPDCSEVAFHSNRAGNSDIWTMNFSGGALTNRTEDSPEDEESAPAYSPDGTQIAFQSNRDTVTGQPRNYEIYKMNVDGTGVTRLSNSGPSGGPLGAALTDLTGYDLFPAWSPDGSRICFHSGRAEENRHSGFPTIIGQWELYTLDAVSGEPAGTATERLTNRAGNDERCAWGVAVP